MVDFREKVFDLVCKIPKGKVTTYGELARALGKPRSARVVGQILKSNTHPDKIPCFKVIRSDGSLGGYTPLGINEKIGRLKKEGIRLKNKKIDLSIYMHKF